MALSKRNKKESVLPEVDQYYQAEKRDRAGLAWLLAMVSIAVIAGLLVALFLGGRWVYNEITQSDEPGRVSVDEGVDAPSIDGPAIGTSDEEALQSGSNGQADDDSEATEGETSPEASPEPVQRDESTAPTSAANGNGELPNTGPGNVVALFAGVSTLAGGTHYLIQRRKLNR